ncbi:MAG: type II toxin-antitoxin system VapC family toxin [Propionibacteriaceae bacterium]|jgi:PIN domain nuclease of toxin-antitoxin system|nr:type II toxin-antitoxin system VapC family toxin [Propionibacteriaceae bacterium]
MRLLLDTHIFLWAVCEPTKLSQRVVDLLTDRDNELVVSAVVPWELAIKFHSGKLPEAEPVLADFGSTLLRLGASSLPITHSHTLHAGHLTWAHRDPFDRLLAAIAALEGMPLVSTDEVFDQAPGLRRIW